MPNFSQPSTPGAEAKRPRLGYLLSRYPAISHTFFLKEVLGLRERGMEVHVASINSCDRSRKDLPEIELVEADKTFYVKGGGMAKVALRVLAIAFKNPVVTLRGFRAAQSLGGWNLKSRVYALFYLAEALLVGQWMRRNSLPHLHVHFGGPVATVGMLTAKAWQIPWSITLHGPDEFYDQEAFYLQQKIESAAFIVCISDFCRSQTLRISPEVPDSHLEVVRLGVDCCALQPRGSNSTSSAARSLHLVCTGRLVSNKGHRILLEAIAPLVASGLELSCTLIGDGPERKYLQSLSADLSIGSQVHFLGAMAHQPALDEVAKADIFVLASFGEGLPVSLMEAMALGVPCISTAIAAIPELIHHGENGLLVPPANPEALRLAIQQLAGDPTFRRELGLRSRATVENDYNLDRNLERLAAMWSRRLGNLSSHDVN